MDINRFMYHILQLAEIFLDIHSQDNICDLCGCTIDCLSLDEGLDHLLRDHLRCCPMLTQFAVLLCQPVWHRAFSPIVQWPTREALIASHQERERRKWKLKVPISDPAELSYVSSLWEAASFAPVFDSAPDGHAQLPSISHGKVLSYVD